MGVWMWHDGDYEVYHFLSLHLRREERGYIRPPFWKLATPYPTVKFKRHITCSGGYLCCQINGQGYVEVDKMRFCAGERIEIAPGTHRIRIQVANTGGLPAAFVDSDICPSGEGWMCSHFAGDYRPVGYLPEFNRLDQNPEIFPFSYERKLPVAKTKTEHGMLYDFGTELFGFFNLCGTDPSVQFSVYYGESEAESLDTDHCYLTDQVSGNSVYRLKQRAFRYIQVIPDPCDADISADFEYIPLTQLGCFHCNDPLFNQISSASAYTFHLNCREGFLDGIKRDRWVWSGDAYQSARINRYLFADKAIEQRTLLGLVGREPIEQHINTILDYSLLWFIFLYEHYMSYGDRGFLQRIWPMAQKLLAFCETRINQDGFIEGIGDDWTFIDWSEIEKIGAVCAEQMLLIRVYEVMAELSAVLGLDSHAFQEKHVRLKKQVNDYFWDPEKGAFIDSYTSGNAHVTRHANIFAVLFDIATDAQAESILNNVLNNDAITKITTPYFEGYELDALAKLGDYSKVEEVLRSYYGGMLRLGAKTIWEEYSPEMSGNEHFAMYGGKYEKSLCHAWGAGSIYLFGRYFLGVKATSPGYQTFTVEPALGCLQSISGTVPVNGGTVDVKLDDRNLTVMATKSGGTLHWRGTQYPLRPNIPVNLQL